MRSFGTTGSSLSALALAGVLGLCAAGRGSIVTIDPGDGVYSAALATLNPGDELHLNPGDYTEGSDTTPTIPDGVVVRGLGAGPGDVRILRTTDSKQVVSSGATTGSTVTNMSFYRSGAGNTAGIHSSLPWLTVQNCIFDGTNMTTGVAVGQGVSARGTTLEGVEIRNMLDRGIRNEGTTETNIIRNCNVHHNAGPGIEIPDGQTPVVVISGGTVAANTNHGVFVEGAPARITGCTIVSNLQHGIRLWYGASGGSIVSNCTVERNGWEGVQVYKSSNSKVKDSRINFNGVLGTDYRTVAGVSVEQASNCEVSGNTLSNNNQAAYNGLDATILLRTPNGVVVRGNTLAGGGPHYGLVVMEGGASQIAIVEQNIVSGHSRYGIQQEADGATILSTSNLYYNNGKHGLRPEAIITSRWDTLWANNDNGAQADGDAILDIQNSLVIGNKDNGLGQGASATVVSDYNDVFGNVLVDYDGVAAGANDVSVDPVFYSVDPTDDGFLYLTWGASPASVTTGSDVGNQRGARDVCPASVPPPMIFIVR